MTKIKKEIRESNYTIVQLANKLEMSPQGIYAIMDRGLRNKTETSLKLAKILKKSIKSILE